MNKNFKKITLLLVALIISTVTLSASVIDDEKTTEHVALIVRDLKICHQEDWRDMTVEVEFESGIHAEDVDVRSIRNHVRSFLESYEKPKDFWEVMNVKLVKSLVEKFPSIEKMTAKISLKPDNSLFFPRQSTVKYDEKEERLKEYFQFKKLNYEICQQSFQVVDFDIFWTMKDDPKDSDYPDYQWVDDAIEEFFAETKLSFSCWEEIKPELQKFLLKRFASLNAIAIDITVVK